MKKLLIIVCALVAGFHQSPIRAEGSAQATVLIVVGAGGEEEYAEQFAKWAGLWQQACIRGGAKAVTIGKDAGGTNALLEFKSAIAKEQHETSAELWVVLLGHGTFDGKEAKFNLRGNDLTISELAEWLQPVQRPLAVIDTSSASGPLLKALSHRGRVIITATRSGYEQNYAHFGQYISEAIADPNADLDKDGQTSLLEAFLSASQRVKEFYETEGRLVTEHALIDDNGDGFGTPSDWFKGIRAVKKSKEGASSDGLRAHQLHLVRSEAERALSPEIRAQRDELELAIAKLREAKSDMEEKDYYVALEKLLLKIARLYEKK